MFLCFSEHQAYPRCHEGVLRGEPSALDPLLNGQLPINTRDVDGNTALALAAFCDHRHMVKSLLAKGAHVNAKDNKSQTPLHKACRQGHSEIVEMLLDHKADINRKKCRDETPLILACSRGHLSVVQMLLDSGADIHVRDMYDRLPLHWAIKGGNLEIVKMLHKQGSKLTSCDQFRKNTIIQAAKCNQADILDFILETSSEGLDKEDSLMRGPMQIAAVKNSCQCLSSLICHGVSINHQSSRGKTALMEAAFAGNLESIELLLKYSDCDVNMIDEYGSTALILSIMGRVSSERLHRNKLWFDVIFSLVNANTDLAIKTRSTMFWDRSAINMHTQNALELALKAGHTDTVKLLARAGSDLGNLVVYFKLSTKTLPQHIRKNQRLFDWLKRFHKLPRPLVEMCRNSFRKHYGSRWIQICEQLDVAPAVRRYLNLADMDDLVEANHVNSETVRIRELSGRQDDNRGDRSEVEYEPSEYNSDWYGKLDHIVDTESEGEEERPSSSSLVSMMPGTSWYGSDI